MNVQADWKLVTAGVLGIVGLYLFFKHEADKGASALAKGLNVGSRENFLYQGVSAVVGGDDATQKSRGAGDALAKWIDPDGYATLDKYRAK